MQDRTRRPSSVALVALVAPIFCATLSAATTARAEEVELAPPAPSAPAAPLTAPGTVPSAPVAPATAPAAPAADVRPAAPLAAPARANATEPVAPQSPPALSFRGCAETPQGCTAEARPNGGWYGYQTLATDAIAVTLAFAAVKLGPVAGVASFGTYLLGAPIVHAVNGRPAMLAASLGTRVLSPILGAVSGFAIGGAVDGCRGGGDYMCGGPVGGAAIGVLSGLTAAVVLDAAVFSRVHPEATTPARQAWDGKPTLAPTMAASPTGGTVGLGGVF